MIKEITRNFETFVGSIDMDYHERYDLYQVACRGESAFSRFRVEKANNSDDDLVIHIATGTTLRLTGKARSYLPQWIDQHLMGGMDAESYYGMRCQMEED